MEPRVAGHIVAKMEEAHPLCARWKTEVAAGREEATQKAEDARQVEEEWQAAPSMLFQPTGLLGSEVASGKGKGKGKVHTHVGGAAQGKRQVICPILRTNKVQSSALTGS